MSIFSKMTSIADAIRVKTGKSGKLTLDDMAIEIANIETGVDTSDATAVESDILSGKTAYVNGNKITGSYEGVELNFKVVGRTTRPTNPTENMIWVNTDTEITGYYFSSTQPENMIDGEVWIPIGSPSTIKVNVLKENGVIVCPLSTHQMISGELKEVPAKCYQNGEWNELWNGYLFNNGNIPGIVTGWTTNGGSSTYLTFTVGNVITATAEKYGVTYFYPSPAIDLTPYSKFVVDINVDRYESGYDNYICISKAGTTTLEASKATTKTGRQTLELDISTFEGAYYCGAYIKSWRGAKTTATVYSMKLVK